MIGVICRLHSVDGDDLGVATLPPPIESGDLVAVDRGEYRVLDVVVSPPGSVIGALVRVQPTRLLVVAV